MLELKKKLYDGVHKGRNLALEMFKINRRDDRHKMCSEFVQLI